MEREQSFTAGPILGPLVRFALSVLLAMFLQALYGAIDLWVVGKYALAGDVSGVSTGSQIMQTVTMVITGLAMGITVLVGQKIGEGCPEEAGRAIGTGISLFFLMALSIFRGIGDSKMPLYTVAIASAFNVAGDLLFVAVFGMGAAGAAIATVLAQGLSVALSWLLIRRRKLPFTMRPADLRPDRTVVRRILSLGVPIALQDLLVSISFLVLLAYDWPRPAAPGSTLTAGGVTISGGFMAAPMAGELIANILDYLGYEKEGGAQVSLPDVVGEPPAQARAELAELGLEARLLGEGTVVTEQVPAPGTAMPAGGSVALTLGDQAPDQLDADRAAFLSLKRFVDEREVSS